MRYKEKQFARERERGMATQKVVERVGGGEEVALIIGSLKTALPLGPTGFTGSSPKYRWEWPDEVKHKAV